jgi:hypothetical protein
MFRVVQDIIRRRLVFVVLGFPRLGSNREILIVVLAGLGALGLAARFGWRRIRGEIA